MEIIIFLDFAENSPQLCINTAIVFVKRFFMYHSMKKCDKHKISLAALFLACKSENSLVKLEQMVHYYLKFVFPYKKHGVNSQVSFHTFEF